MIPRGQPDYKKRLLGMRQFLLGKDYHNALAAMEFAMVYHVGSRKDGMSPEFSHQMFIADYALTIIPLLMYPEGTIAAIFLHDICEDYDVTYDDIEKLFPHDPEFGRRVRVAVELLTKKKDGIRIPDDIYYARLGTDPIASVAKGIDRAHNIHSMHNAGWDISKQQAYLDFVFDKVLPMLKVARRAFTRQAYAYENIKTVLLMQAHPIQMLLDTKSEFSTSEDSVPQPSA